MSSASGESPRYSFHPNSKKFVFGDSEDLARNASTLSNRPATASP
jgi:hypothetical protein